MEVAEDYVENRKSDCFSKEQCSIPTVINLITYSRIILTDSPFQRLKERRILTILGVNIENENEHSFIFFGLAETQGKQKKIRFRRQSSDLSGSKYLKIKYERSNFKDTSGY